MNLIPTVMEEERGGVRVYYDLFSRLLKDRIVFIGGQITEELANIVIAELVYLEKQNPKKDIQMYILTPGGSVAAGLAIYDTMQYIKPDVVTIGIGRVASFGSVLLAAGTKGKRFLLPHADVMIHQPWISGISSVTVTDLKITTNFLERTKKRLIKILAKHTGQSEATIARDTERDFWMNAAEAKKYGIVDKIL